MMKNLFLTTLTLLFFVLIGCDNDSEKVINEASLPQPATTFVETHFPDAAIQRVVRDKDDASVSYDVWLDNQVKLEFNRDGECYDIESREKLPDSVIPSKILEYAQANYPNFEIISWDKDRTDQEVKLSNGLELVFDLNGAFIRIDR